MQVRPEPSREYHLDSSRIEALADTVPGKTSISFARLNLDTGEIIEAYHGQSGIEHVVRAMKDRATGTWWPLNHWTDQNIRVHGLYRTLAVLRRALIRRRAAHAGLPLTLNRLLTELTGSREVASVYRCQRQAKAPRQRTVPTRLNEIPARWVKLLNLEAGRAALG